MLLAKLSLFNTIYSKHNFGAFSWVEEDRYLFSVLSETFKKEKLSNSLTNP